MRWIYNVVLTAGCLGTWLTCAWAGLEMDLRHEASRSLPDNFQQTLVWNPTTSWGGYALGARFVEESAQVDRLVYFGEVSYMPLSFLSLSARLLQHARIEDESGSTVAAAVLSLCTSRDGVRTYDSVRFCTRFGGQRKLWQIDKRAWLPLVYRSAVEEWDLAVRFDLDIRWSESWESALTLGTFENVDFYNLHNPYLQLRLGRARLFDNAELFLLLRYQVLLGFAILDNWTTGIGLRVEEF